MYPYITLGSTENEIHIFTFGITLIISTFLFGWMLRKLSKKGGVNFRFFSRNFLLFIVSIFVFGRLFYFLEHIDQWSYSMRYGLQTLLFSTNYNLSLVGSIFGFLVVLWSKVESFGLNRDKYLDISVLSFLFASWVGWIGGFISEVIYGQNTSLLIGVSYNNPDTTVPIGGDLFPLGITYAIVTFFLFFVIYTMNQTSKIHGLSAALGFIGFSIMLFVGEFFDGARENNNLLFGYFSITQVCCVLLFLLGSHELFKFVIKPLQK
ncbi:MAG: prolipoprotein diacylglyceryl transferase family protein [Candidatus Gracilibacteria bacterium]